MKLNARGLLRLALLLGPVATACDERFYCDQPLSCDTDAGPEAAFDASRAARSEGGEVTDDLDAAKFSDGESGSDSVTLPSEAGSELTDDSTAGEADASSTREDSSAPAPPAQGSSDAAMIEVEAGLKPSTGCEKANGGCDALTECEPSNEGRTCSACPNGYDGDGETGCQPTLLDLTVIPSALHPSFESTHGEYSVQVPISSDTIALSAEVPQGASLKIQGDEVGNGMSWLSPSLVLGDNAIALEVSRPGTATRTYQLVATRGAVAYVKAETPLGLSRFGWDVALSADGDTLAVGAGFESHGPDVLQSAGAVYVFGRSQEGWIQTARLTASNAGGLDLFGASIALSDDGKTLAIGAPDEDSDAIGVDGDQDNEALPTQVPSTSFKRRRPVGHRRRM